MNRFRSVPAHLATSLIAAALLAACGGGSGETATTATTGVSSSGVAVYEGPISGFGSVVVNGVRFSESAASVVDEDGASVSRADLNLGSTVRVEGRADDGSGSGRADRIVLMPELRGTITAIDAAAGRLTVMDQVVMVDTATVLEGFVALADLKIGDRVEVHGLRDANGNLLATLLEKKSALPAMLIRGTATNVNAGAKTFQIGPLTISFATATIGPDGAAITDGARLVVRSVAAPVNGVLTADRIKVRRVSDDLRPTNGFVAIKGLVERAADSSGVMTVSGVQVDTSKAKMAGGIEPIAGMRVHVVGAFVGDTLVASRVVTDSSRKKDGHDLNELHGVVSSLDDPTHFVVHGVAVDASAAKISGNAAQVSIGVYVEVHGRVETGPSGSVLKATKVEISTKGAVDGDDHDVPADALRSFYGAVTDFVSLASFKLNGQAVNASDAIVEGATALADGVYIEVKGKLVEGVLVATKVEVKRARLVTSARS